MAIALYTYNDAGQSPTNTAKDMRVVFKGGQLVTDMYKGGTHVYEAPKITTPSNFSLGLKNSTTLYNDGPNLYSNYSWNNGQPQTAPELNNILTTSASTYTRSGGFYAGEMYWLTVPQETRSMMSGKLARTLLSSVTVAPAANPATDTGVAVTGNGNWSENRLCYKIQVLRTQTAAAVITVNWQVLDPCQYYT